MCTLLVGIAPGVTAVAQDYEVFSFNSTIEPSVETFNIAQYGKLEPSLYTGTMSYSLPIYVYEDPDFTIPISLDYSFNGYKPSVHSGTVGYGWALNCGGIITREVKGMPDDAAIDAETNTAGYYHAIEQGLFEGKYQIINSKQHFLEHRLGNEEELGQINIFSDRPMYIQEHKVGLRYDACPDIFHFNFLGYSGSFTLTKSGAVKVFDCNHPTGEISVQCTFTHSDPRSDSFSEIVIMTGDGYAYYFGGSYKNVEYNRTMTDGNANPDSISGWKLRKITAPNSSCVEFIYDNIQKDRTIFESYTPAISADFVNTSTSGGDYETSKSEKYTNSTYYSLLSKVRVNGVKIVDFTYTEKDYNENDQANFTKTLSPLSDPFVFRLPQSELRLKRIRINNNSNQTVDEILLEHEYRHGQASRMLLSSVTSQINGTHLFEYNSHSQGIPKNDTYSTDHWGYWNGLLNPGSIKQNITGPIETDCNLYNQLGDSEVKEANELYSKNCGLKKITYPTGGYSNISYEANYAKYLIQNNCHFLPSQNIYKTGGVRVAKIENISDEISDSTIYSYDDGILMYMPRYATKLEYKYVTVINGAVDPNIDDPVDANVVAYAYTEDCNFAAMRGPHMAYGSVTATHSDHSYTIYIYLNANQSEYLDNKLYTYDSTHDVYSGLKVHEKDCYFSESDYIDSQYDNYSKNHIRYIFMPYINDYSNIRGKLESIREYDKDDELKKWTRYGYHSKLAHTDTLVYNTLLDFTEAPLNLYVPQLNYEVSTEYFGEENISTWTVYNYNSKGQQTSVSSSTPTDNVTKYFRYYWEAFPDNIADTLQNVVSNVATVKNGYLVSGISFTHSDSGNPQPISATHYSSEAPINDYVNLFSIPEGYRSLTATYSYDSTTNRLTREDFPGDRYYEYTWDDTGRNILSVINNHADNVTQYQWKDMVGLTGTIYPSNIVTYYVYDNSNRLSQQKNTNSQIEKEYKYHLVNE